MFTFKKEQFTKQNWIDGESLFNLPPRNVTWSRVGLHLLFWVWNSFSAYTALDRVLRIDPLVSPDKGLFQLMFSTHVATTFILFYSFGYLVVPSLLNLLVYHRATKRIVWRKTIIVALSSAFVYIFFNIYDYYLFTYAAEQFKPNPAYIKRYNDLLLASGPVGVLWNYSLFTFIWAYNVSYLMLPLLLRIIREAISWGVMSVEQKEQNQILIQNQLQALHYQINPHFLFNVFNSIYGLIHRTNTQAADLLMKLSELMHYTLYDTNENFVPLAGEFKFLHNYVAIEQSRHFDADQITFAHTGNPDLYLVPPLLLVTFIENAFKHGLNKSYDRAWVRIELDINSQQKALVMKVSNNLPVEPLPRASDGRFAIKPLGGLGLVNARKRLNLLFGPDQYSLVLQETNTEYQVALTIPLKLMTNREYQSAY